jgi:lysine 2,3-aminomutase
MKLHRDDLKEIIFELNRLAILKRYTKIFAKVPEWAVETFLENEYVKEACIPGFYNRRYKVCFLSQFYGASRSYISKKDKRQINSILWSSSNAFNGSDLRLPGMYSIKVLDQSDLKPLSKLYRQVFQVYPFPIFDTEYLKQTMNENVLYMGIFKEGKLISAASAEMDLEGKNAEMTDFATHPKHLGQNLSFFLLQYLENEMLGRGIKTVYTISRAFSHGMNKTFGRSQYRYGGTLINNTQIGESIECMNVWYKNLRYEI